MSIEAETIIDRAGGGMERKAAKGLWTGGARPFGYRLDRDHHGVLRRSSREHPGRGATQSAQPPRLLGRGAAAAGGAQAPPGRAVDHEQPDKLDTDEQVRSTACLLATPPVEGYGRQVFW